MISATSPLRLGLFVMQTNERHTPLELVLLKVNPARRLYDRLGFRAYKEDANRYYMRVAV